jgi:hypothetical protein
MGEATCGIISAVAELTLASIALRATRWVREHYGQFTIETRARVVTPQAETPR